jgi:hypothetical protein
LQPSTPCPLSQPYFFAFDPELQPNWGLLPFAVAASVCIPVLCQSLPDCLPELWDSGLPNSLRAQKPVSTIHTSSISSHTHFLYPPLDCFYKLQIYFSQLDFWCSDTLPCPIILTPWAEQTLYILLYSILTLDSHF